MVKGGLLEKFLSASNFVMTCKIIWLIKKSFCVGSRVCGPPSVFMGVCHINKSIFPVKKLSWAEPHLVLEVVSQDPRNVDFGGSVKGQDLSARDALWLELNLLALKGILEALVENKVDLLDLVVESGSRNHLQVLKTKAITGNYWIKAWIAVGQGMSNRFTCVFYHF